MEAIRTAIHAPRASLERRRYDEALAAARSKLYEAKWQAAWAEGQAMTLEQAIAYALRDET